MTPARRVLRAKMAELAQARRQWFPDRDPSSLRILEIGIAGDDPPGANREFFHSASYETADVDAALKPDYVLDLTEVPHTCGQWDIVICSQVLEHIWDLEAACDGLWRLTAQDGRCLVDVPFCYPPHKGKEGQPDYWRLTPAALERLLRRAGFARAEFWTDPAWLIVGAVAAKDLSTVQKGTPYPGVPAEDAATPGALVGVGLRRP